jgi:hypothetical protein
VSSPARAGGVNQWLLTNPPVCARSCPPVLQRVAGVTFRNRAGWGAGLGRAIGGRKGNLQKVGLLLPAAAEGTVRTATSHLSPGTPQGHQASSHPLLILSVFPSETH